MHIGQPHRIQLLEQVRVQRVGMRVRRGAHQIVVKGRKAQGRTVGTDLSSDRVHDLEGKAAAVLDRSAVRVRPAVARVFEELLDQVAGGPVDFDPVEAGLEGVGGAAAVVVDDGGNFL